MEKMLGSGPERPKGFLNRSFLNRYYNFRLGALESTLRAGSYDHGNVQVARSRTQTRVSVWGEGDEYDVLRLTTLKFSRDEVTQRTTRIDITIKDYGEGGSDYPEVQARLSGSTTEGETYVLGQAVGAMKNAMHAVRTLAPDRVSRTPGVN